MSTLSRTRVKGLLTVTLGAALFGCGATEPDHAASLDSGATKPWFVDVSTETGLLFTHHNGARGNYFFPEINGSGAALLDYDGDGDLDVYLVQGGTVPGDLSSPSVESPSSRGNRLFRNLLVPTGELRFEDVTAIAGGGDDGYGMGVASGDYDNDGDVDLYVMNVGDNVFYRNDAGKFTDVTALTGANVSDWSASGTFTDYDGDGDLDLFVANYVDWHADTDRPCQDDAGQRDYCSPSNYPPVGDRLFRNDGDGVFSDVTRSTGIAAAAGPGLGVISADFNGDGRTDIYVANDQQANHLWLNQDLAFFTESGLPSGSAYNGQGSSEASMGVTAGDFDGDGDEDLFMTHLTSQSNTLYANNGRGNFEDISERANLGAVSMRFTGFGTAWLDYDNDGLLDLFVANGAVMILPENRDTSVFPYQQANQLFHNDGGGRFRDVSELAGPALAVQEVSRGAAFGDIDNDGDIDILVTNNSGPARLLRNDVGQDKHWLRLRLVGTESPRDAQGARVALLQPDGTRRWLRAHSDGSYASASDARVLFGLGDAQQPATVEVSWSSGRKERFEALTVDSEHRLKEGAGK